MSEVGCAIENGAMVLYHKCAKVHRMAKSIVVQCIGVLCAEFLCNQAQRFAAHSIIRLQNAGE